MRDYRFYLRARNNHLVTRREELGLSAPQVAVEIGLSYTRYYALESLRQSPISKQGGWLPAAQKIADFHRTDCASLWPEQIRHVRFSKTVEWQMDVEELPIGLQRKMLPPSQLYDDREREEVVAQVLSELPKREAEVLRRRFGLDGDKETMEQIGDDFGISRTRVQHIEQRALMRLRTLSLPSAGALREVDADN